MKLLIISCSPRLIDTSNTKIVLDYFSKGLNNKGITPEVCYLQKRGQWKEIYQKVEEHENIIFALPLYIDTVPALLLEFLEGLMPKKIKGNMAFIVISGFPEALQFDCCIKYLKDIPNRYNCENKGILYKGNTFGLHLFDPRSSLFTRTAEPFIEMGEVFAEVGKFPSNLATAFAGPYRLSRGQCFMMKLFMPIQNSFLKKTSKALGCKTKLTDKPLISFVKK